jgi:hypothetical protein
MKQISITGRRGAGGGLGYSDCCVQSFPNLVGCYRSQRWRLQNLSDCELADGAWAGKGFGSPQRIAPLVAVLLRCRDREGVGELVVSYLAATDGRWVAFRYVASHLGHSHSGARGVPSVLGRD